MVQYLATALIALSITAYANPIHCPVGTVHTSKDLVDAGVLVEWCEDGNGVKEGPLRVLRKSDGRVEAEYPYHAGKKHGVALIYDEDGLLEMEVSFIDGEEAESRLSSNGLQRIIEQINAEARRVEKRWQISKISDIALQYDITVGFPWWLFMSEERDIAEKLSSNAEICALFQLPGTRFDSVQARYIKASGELLVETTIKPGDCVSSEADLTTQ